MLLSEKVELAKEYIKTKIEAVPDIAVVLGSGLGNLADEVESPVIIPYTDIPYWPRSTVTGHAGRLVIGKLHGTPVIMMQGRVHYYEGYSMTEVTFPTRVLAVLGIKAIVLTNASGGVNTDIKPGTIVAIQDHINYMGINPLIGENNPDWGVRFPDMTMAYDRDFIKLTCDIAEREGILLRKGVYIAFSGPSFETPAEIRMARILGADVVGMSTVPEVIAANHMGVRVCGISCVANYGAGITDNKLTHQEVMDAMNAASGSLCKLVSKFIKEVKL